MTSNFKKFIFDKGERFIIVNALKYVYDLYDKSSMTYHTIGHLIKQLEDNDDE